MIASSAQKAARCDQICTQPTITAPDDVRDRQLGAQGGQM
jgi:hypothetical protein